MFGKKKDKFENLINYYKKTPSLVNLEVEDLKTLPEEVLNSPLNNQYTYGYKDMRTMICAISNKLDDYCPLYKNEVKFKGIFFAHSHNKPVDYTTMFGSFYFRVYFGNDTLYVYELDQFVRVINSHIFKIADISGIANTTKHLILKYSSSNTTRDNTFLFVKQSENDTKLYDALMSNGLSKDLIIEENIWHKLLSDTDKIG